METVTKHIKDARDLVQALRLSSIELAMYSEGEIDLTPDELADIAIRLSDVGAGLWEQARERGHKDNDLTVVFVAQPEAHREYLRILTIIRDQIDGFGGRSFFDENKRSVGILSHLMTGFLDAKIRLFTSPGNRRMLVRMKQIQLQTDGEPRAIYGSLVKVFHNLLEEDIG